MSYLVGYVIPVPNENREKYREHAAGSAAVFREYGATELVECWGDDVPDGELTSFPKAVQCKPDETVVLGWIRWPSKAAHDAGMPKAMEDPRMKGGAVTSTFDGKRLIFGRFEAIVEA